MIGAGKESPGLPFLAEQRQRHQPVMKRIDRGIMECSGARKNFVGFGMEPPDRRSLKQAPRKVQPAQLRRVRA